MINRSKTNNCNETFKYRKLFYNLGNLHLALLYYCGRPKVCKIKNGFMNSLLVFIYLSTSMCIVGEIVFVSKAQSGQTRHE